ncbi:MAG: hypothetical protein IJ891_05780 [Prevotella sp.]|nr:hypothetical protein [Prevotella sp.]
MAKYIMSILKTQLMVVWSWGFHNPIALGNGLQFNVQGFKFRGVVEVVYNEGHDLFDVRFIKANKVVNTIEGVFFDMLVDVIDDYVERTPDYEQRVKEEYSISLY